MEILNDGYYHLAQDLRDYPDAWCYVIWSRRGPGKTYSALRYGKENNIKFIYMKRTIEDTDLICSGNQYDFDPSPYVPLNRDLGWNVKAKSIKKGVGAFYDCNEENDPEGLPISYILALNAVKKFKGFDFSECDWIILDEFIPQTTEIVKRGEGEQLLDLYMTVARDRQKRGRKPLKLILLANAEEISAPICNTLEIVDTMADLNASGKTHYYDFERGIMFHHITEEEIPIREEEKQGIFKAMDGTAWAAKSFGGDFANNDFTSICKKSLKNYRCLYEVLYKQKKHYIYVNSYTGEYRMCTSPSKNAVLKYDLNRENDQKRFYVMHGIDLREATIENRMTYEAYSEYDLIVNYSKFFKI